MLQFMLALIMISFCCVLFYNSVCHLNLSVRAKNSPLDCFSYALTPRVSELRKPVFDVVFITYFVESMGMFGAQMLSEQLIGELRPIVCQYLIDFKWTIINKILQKGTGNGLRHA